MKVKIKAVMVGNFTQGSCITEEADIRFTMNKSNQNTQNSKNLPASEGRLPEKKRKILLSYRFNLTEY